MKGFRDKSKPKEVEALMKKLTSITAATLLSLLGIANPVSAEGMIPASGNFTVAVDFTTLALTPVGATPAFME